MFTWTCIFLPAGEAFSDYTKQFKFFLLAKNVILPSFKL